MLKVSFDKLQKYTEEHGSYELIKEGDSIVLSFVPNFPEAVEKGDTNPPRVTLLGRLIEDNKVVFDKVEIEDSLGQRVRDKEEAELVYGSWLDYIEQNC